MYCIFSDISVEEIKQSMLFQDKDFIAFNTCFEIKCSENRNDNVREILGCPESSSHFIRK